MSGETSEKKSEGFVAPSTDAKPQIFGQRKKLAMDEFVKMKTDNLDIMTDKKTISNCDSYEENNLEAKDSDQNLHAMSRYIIMIQWAPLTLHTLGPDTFGH